MQVDEATGWVLNNEAFFTIAASADALEGAVAFAEKRAAVWQGK